MPSMEQRVCDSGVGRNEYHISYHGKKGVERRGEQESMVPVNVGLIANMDEIMMDVCTT